MARRSKLSSALCFATFAPILMAFSCSTGQRPTLTVGLPANLMASPPELPRFPRNADGSLDGRKAVVGALDLYSVAGSIRLQLIALQEAERLRQAAK